MSSNARSLYEFGPFRLDVAEHRLLRENTILKVWNSGVHDIPEIVKKVYTEVDPSLPTY